MQKEIKVKKYIIDNYSEEEWKFYLKTPPHFRNVYLVAMHNKKRYNYTSVPAPSIKYEEWYQKQDLMPFSKIAKNMRTSENNVRRWYDNAVKKLQNNPRFIELFKEWI